MSSSLYTLYGITGSLYTGKVRAYLRHHNIPFEERAMGHADFAAEIVPKIGRMIVPVLVTPEGMVIQDGTDILDHLETTVPSPQPIYPDHPVLRAISYLFELFGGEGLLRPAMHYRWNFDEENLIFLKSFFSEMTPTGSSKKEIDDMFGFASGLMRAASVAFGVVPETMREIESTYTDFLTRLEAHFSKFGFLLGGYPTGGDYGLFNPLYAHLGRDPHPANLMKQIAPHVYKWTEHMNGPESYVDHRLSLNSNELFAPDDIPATLKDLMRYIAEEYLSELAAHVAFTNDWLAERPTIEPGTNGLDDPAQRAIGMAEFNWRGHDIKTVVMPYRFYLLQRLTDCVANAQPDDQKSIRALFKETGLEKILDLRTTRRVERLNHLEVWGESQ